jgi:hypothetical protein
MGGVCFAEEVSASIRLLFLFLYSFQLGKARTLYLQTKTIYPPNPEPSEDDHMSYKGKVGLMERHQSEP